MPELGTCKLSRQPSLRLKQHLAHGWELDGESAGERGAATELRAGWNGGAVGVAQLIFWGGAVVVLLVLAAGRHGGGGG